MSSIHDKIVYPIGLLCILLLTFVLFSSNEKEAAASEIEVIESVSAPSTIKAIPQSGMGFQNNVYSPPMPSSMTFAGEPVPLNDFEVRERIDRELMVNTYWQSSTLKMIKLAHRYFPTIEKILQEQGMPDDLKYLALAESGLTNATSSAGAKGFWQFLKSTAIQYGMEVNGEVDERYHLEKATVGACKYFRKAKAKFGDYTMAAASYNMGMTGLKNQAVRQKNDYYYDLLLNDETKRYVPRIIAIKEIVSNPEAYGFFVQDHEKYPPVDQYREVLVDKSIPNLADFAIEQGINYKILKFYNPWLRDNVLTVQKNRYKIKIPI